jgi:hypothetical protein
VDILRRNPNDRRGFGDRDQIEGQVMARTVRKSGVKEVPLSEVKLENDLRFLRRIEQARNSLQAGRGVRLEDVETE